MSFRRVGLLLAVVALAPGRAWASDAPHNSGGGHAAGVQLVSCTSCHVGHNATGAGLTNNGQNFNVCQSCHTNSLNFGFNAWTTADQATPGAMGYHHRWDSSATSTDHEATLPADTGMLARINGNAGKLDCSVCHDQHTNTATLAGADHTQHISPVNHVKGTGPGTVSVASGVSATTPAKSYLMEILSGGTTFHVSNDDGITWGSTLSNGTGVAIDPLASTVKATFSGTFTATDQYAFYVSYPFLRVANTSSSLCLQCHTNRGAMTMARVEGTDASYVPDGVKLFSHPVGSTAVMSTKTTRSQANVLDANGALQSGAGDGITTNNFNFTSSSSVHCMTCHYPHNTDSNSLTEDVR